MPNINAGTNTEGVLLKHVTTPSTPGSGYTHLYVLTGDEPAIIGSGGAETKLLIDDGSVAGATAGAQDFGANGITADAIAASAGASIEVSDGAPFRSLVLPGAVGDGGHQYFDDNDSSYPAGWTQNDAPAATNTDRLRGFWYVLGSSSITSWQYSKQPSGVTIDKTVIFGPLFWRVTTYTADVNYYLSINADDGLGAIDPDIFARLRIYYDSGAGVWKYQPQHNDGGGLVSGTAVTFSRTPDTGVIYAGCTLGTTYARVGISTTPYIYGIEQLSQATISISSADLWLNLHQDRGTGVSDQFYIAGYDILTGILF